MNQWPPSTPGTFGHDNSGAPDPVMRLLQWLRDQVIQSNTPGGDVSDPINFGQERARVIADYAKRGTTPNQLSESPMTQDVLARAASRPPTNYQQGNPGGAPTNDTLIANLAAQTERARSDPQDTTSREQIKTLLITLNSRGISPDQALALVQRNAPPSSPRWLAEPPVVPTRFDEQFAPTPLPLGPAQPPTSRSMPLAASAPPTLTPLSQGASPTVDPAELQRQRDQVVADYAARTEGVTSPPPSNARSAPPYLQQIIDGTGLNAPTMPAPPPPAAQAGSLTPVDLNLPMGPRPPMPMPPDVVSRDPRQDLMRAITIGLMLGAGPRSGIGTGAGQGFLSAQAARQAEQDRLFKLKEAAAEKQRGAYDAQQKQLQAQLMTVSKRVESIKNKAQYDQEITGYANMMRESHPWLTANWLRQAVPFVAPDRKAAIAAAFEGWLKNPLNTELIKNHPDELAKQAIDIDRDGDGHVERVPILLASQIAGKPFSVDATTGTLVTYPKGTTADNKANADGIFEDLLAQAKAEGKDPNSPRLRASLRQQAIQLAAEAKPLAGDFEAFIRKRETELGRKLTSVEMAKAKQEFSPPASILLNTSTAPDRKNNAQQIVLGNMLPSMLSRRSADYNATLTEANRLSIEQTGKPINLVKLQLDYEAAKRFVSSMNAPNQVRFKGLAGSVVNTIDEVRRLGETLRQGGIQKWNAVKRGTVQQVYGNTPESALAADYITAVNTLKEEFAQLASGGYAPTEAAWHLANEQINKDYGFKDLNASLTEVQRLINYRIAGFDDLTPSTVGGPSSLNQGTTPKGSTEPPADLVYDPISKTFSRPRGR